VSTPCEAPHSEPKVDEVGKKWAFADQPVVDSVTSTDVPPQIRIYPLQYVKVNVAVVECNALNGFSAGQRAEALSFSLDVCLSGDSDMCNIVEKNASCLCYC